ncbi:MAG: HTH domain-containing protein [Peptoniphilaceae bacterium]|nr:HTH domain-containing protein [Peptoniphilaceae bacterium]MDD7434491.1 HTH domain-containing protein [Peptoniphilaceae bacterium]MDY3076478.1 HTH domain-containing protein [Peptoniphilaceae bacterium]
MQKRSEYILRHIAKTRSLKIKDLTKHFQVSSRTIRNDVAEINSFFERKALKPLEITSEGQILVTEDFDPAIHLNPWKALNSYTYRFSPVERQLYIAIRLLWEDETLTMQELADELSVTRGTILNDVSHVKKYFDQLNILFVSEQGKGMFLEATEEERNNGLVDCFSNLSLEVDSDGFFQRFVLEPLNQEFSFNEVYKHVLSYLNLNNLIFVEDRLYLLILYFFVVLQRPQKKTMQADSTDTMESLFLYVGYRLKKTVSREMLDSYLSFCKKHEIFSYIKSMDKLELYEVVVHYLFLIDQDLQLNLRKDPILIDSLVQHIKSMRNWQEEGYDFPNLSSEYADYLAIAESAKSHLPILERYLGFAIKETMWQSIVIHLCVSLLRNEKEEKLTVAIVCPGSMATGKYLEMQVERYFDFDVKGVYAVHSLDELKNDSHLDLVLSTIQVYTFPKPWLKVHAVLTMEDLDQIQRKAQNIKKDQRDFKDSAAQNISSHTLLSEKKKNPFMEFLDPSDIARYEDSLPWQDAIRLSAQPLLAHGTVSKKYVDQAVRNIETYGPYIVLGEGIALAHAAREFGAHDDRLSLLLLPKGTVFPENHRIHFLFFLSAIGIKKLPPLLEKIMRLGQDQKKTRMLLTLDEKELYQALLEDEEDCDL